MPRGCVNGTHLSGPLPLFHILRQLLAPALHQVVKNTQGVTTETQKVRSSPIEMLAAGIAYSNSLVVSKDLQEIRTHCVTAAHEKEMSYAPQSRDALCSVDRTATGCIAGSDATTYSSSQDTASRHPTSRDVGVLTLDTGDTDTGDTGTPFVGRVV